MGGRQKGKIRREAGRKNEWEGGRKEGMGGREAGKKK